MLYGNPVLYHMSVRCPHETRPKLIEQEKGMASYPDWIAHTARDGVSMVAAAEGKGITSTCATTAASRATPSGRRTERDILARRGDQGRRRRARRSLFPQTSSLASLFQNHTAPMPPPWIPPPCPYCHKYRINPPLTFNYIMPPLVTSAPGELRRLHRLRAHE